MTARVTLVERYVLPPAEIEALSLSRVDAMLGVAGEWREAERQVVRRMVYAAGDPALAKSIRIHPGAVDAGCRALRAGRPIITDVRMVEVALDVRLARKFGAPILCGMALPGIAEEAVAQGLQRAVIAMRRLKSELDGAMVVIGNAPTALLSLLDMVDAGVVRPALIIGTPVGFVAAAESKAELAARAVPFVTIEGTRGGSAVAAAAANAIFRIASQLAGAES